MAIERMKLLSIVGKEENMEKFIGTYLIDSGLQPEDALRVYEKGWKLSCFRYDNTAKETLKKCTNIMNKLQMSYSKQYAKVNLECTIEQIINTLEPLEKEINESDKKIEEAKKQIQELEKQIYPISKLKDVKIDLNKFYNLRYIRYRYGKIPVEYYEKIQKDISRKNVIVFEIAREDNYVWIIYFTTKEYDRTVDSYFNVVKFERVWLPSEIGGIPEDAINKINSKIQECKKIIQDETMYQKELKNKNESVLLFMYRQLQLLVRINNVKKFIAHDEDGNFYIIGWIPTSELKEIMPKLSKEKEIEYKIKNHDEVASNPPTHLKNGKIASKFETIVEMYGTPNYTETDPTLFVAITTFLMFGFMFGDVGQGLVIAIIGLILTKKKKSLGPIFIAGGISAIIFGFAYGSIFGKEGIIPALVISPMENITTMLASGIIFGIVLMLGARIINFRNKIKNKDEKKVKEKSSLIEKLFGIIEKILSIVSNTISFVRLAAFAINHVGLCMAVYILSNMVNGAGSLAIAIIGNILVIVLEGLIVAIQVLRLEYYELFSRFYKGDGKPYKPIREEIIED